MAKISTGVLAATVVLWVSMPSALAGDLGDGGYGARGYGQHRPYLSGESEYADPDYGRHDADDNGDSDDDDDDDDDNRSYSRSDDDDDDDDDRRAHRHGDHRRCHHRSSEQDYAPAPRAGIVRPHRTACLPGWQVKKRLIAQGWTDFHLKTYGPNVAVIAATRAHTGRAFILRVDGCTGETLSSVPSGNRHFSDGRPKPRRYSWRD
jgi:hypothetical protein